MQCRKANGGISMLGCDGNFYVISKIENLLVLQICKYGSGKLKYYFEIIYDLNDKPK
jgi:hypothetical protein